MCEVGDNCLVIHDYNRPVNVYRSKNVCRSANTVDATVGYQDLHSGQKFILMINQAICINHLDNHLLCTHAVELTDTINTVHSLIILLQLSSVTSYFEVYLLSIAEYKNEDIPKIHLTAE